MRPNRAQWQALMIVDIIKTYILVWNPIWKTSSCVNLWDCNLIWKTWVFLHQYGSSSHCIDTERSQLGHELQWTCKITQHYGDVIMGSIGSQTTSLTIAYCRIKTGSGGVCCHNARGRVRNRKSNPDGVAGGIWRTVRTSPSALWQQTPTDRS